jgi:hypothetical protein
MLQCAKHKENLFAGLENLKATVNAVFHNALLMVHGCNPGNCLFEVYSVSSVHYGKHNRIEVRQTDATYFNDKCIDVADCTESQLTVLTLYAMQSNNRNNSSVSACHNVEIQCNIITR